MTSAPLTIKIKEAIANEFIKKFAIGIVAAAIFISGGVSTYIFALGHFANTIVPAVDANTADITELKESNKQLADAVDDVDNKVDVALAKLDILLQLFQGAN